MSKDKYNRFDCGGDLGECKEVLDLFESVGYDIQHTALGHLNQNGPVERPTGLSAMRYVQCCVVLIYHPSSGPMPFITIYESAT